MEVLRITADTIPSIVQKLNLAVSSNKPYQVEIKLHDGSLKARQRSLCYCWYREIGEFYGVTTARAAAESKYKHGFRILTREDGLRRKMYMALLGGYDEEQRIAIVEEFPSMFSVLSDKDGMTSEQIGEYLTQLQRHWQEQGLFLTSINEKEMLNYPEAR